MVTCYLEKLGYERGRLSAAVIVKSHLLFPLVIFMMFSYEQNSTS